MNTQKKFDMVSIVILTLMVGSEAIVKTVADLSLGLPVIGEIVFPLADVYTFLIWGVVIIWFVFKLGAFGTGGLILTVGGVLSMLAIPIGLAAGVAIAVYLANHPKVLATAEVVAAPEAGEIGVAAEAEEAAEATANIENAGAAAGGTGNAGRAAPGAEKSAADEAESAGGAQEEGVPQKQGPEIEPGALGEAPEPMDELQQKLTGERGITNESQPSPEEEPENNAPDQESDLKKEQAAKEAKAEQLRKLMDKLPQGQNQQPSGNKDEDKDNEDEYLAAASQQ